MEKKSKGAVVVLVLYGLAALLWTGKCISTLRYGAMDFVSVICAACWIGIFFINLKRYHNENNSD